MKRCRVARPLLLALMMVFADRALAQSAQQEPVRVQLSAVRQTTLSSGITARITHLAVKEGDRVKQGQVLLSFDCAVLKEKLNYASASEQAARKKLEIANRLDKLNSISVSDVEQARSAVSMALAESGVNRAMLERCDIKAPFSGRVTETLVRNWETVPEGKPLLSLYDDSAFELEMIVPSRWLRWLRADTPFSVALDETGQRYPAKISRLSSSVDAVSQSVKVFGQIAGHDDGLLPGMSGVAHFSAPAAPDNPLQDDAVNHAQ
ncbi:efflux RND transporter periplasmic adaptor subunit [Dickeya chrysanthemi]|uniref:efflux RND transporter periplasmic adaptor subunit n=1 Tax=Dickeya chrysanthemi TaxID=556 RepID=UPI003AFB5DD5